MWNILWLCLVMFCYNTSTCSNLLLYITISISRHAGENWRNNLNLQQTTSFPHTTIFSSLSTYLHIPSSSTNCTSLIYKLLFCHIFRQNRSYVNYCHCKGPSSRKVQLAEFCFTAPFINGKKVNFNWLKTKSVTCNQTFMRRSHRNQFALYL